MLRRAKLIVPIFMLCLQSMAAELPTAKPEAMGFSAVQLELLDDHFSRYVDEGKLAGLTTLVSRKGEIVHFKTYGMQNIESGQAMQPDTIFRIYSMTKPVTGVAMMILWEEGKFKLNDPVSKYLPEFKNGRVYVETNEDGSISTEPAEREATILDLMRHTAGLGYGISENHAVEQLYRDSDLFNEPGLTAAIRRAAQLPLVDHPGEQWFYSIATDVQGRLIEILSEQSLDVFFAEHIFNPLGMEDTAFKLRPDQMNRLAELYTHDEDGHLTPALDDPLYWDVSKDPPLLSGGGGLLSTTTDYRRFAQMVANGGELDGVRILKPETVALMTQNQLPDHLQDNDTGFGFGLNFGIVTDMSKRSEYGRDGELHWSGAASTLFWIDPEEEIVAILLTALVPYNAEPLRNDMRNYVYSALIEPSDKDGATTQTQPDAPKSVQKDVIPEVVQPAL